jgi:hypothetical protein
MKEKNEKYKMGNTKEITKENVVYAIVLDYRIGEVFIHTFTLPENTDLEEYFEKKYHSDCYWMSSSKPIEINYE